MGQILDQAISKTMTFSYFQEANQLLRNSQLEDAVVVYRQAIIQNPKFYLSHHNLGEVLWKLGLLEEAITAFQTAVELKPLAVWSYFNLGQVLEQLGKQAESQLAFQKAIELEPKLKEVCRNLEQSFSVPQIVREEIPVVVSERKQQDKAPFNPELAEHYFQLGQEEFAGWQLEKAVQSYRQAVELNPQAPHIHHHLGFTLSRLGQWKEARVFYQKAEELTPNSSAVYEHLGDAWQATGYLDEAISCYRQALRIEPDLVQVQNRLSILIQHESELEGFDVVIDEESSIPFHKIHRKLEVIKKCNKFIQSKAKSILILSKRLNRIFSDQQQNEIINYFKNNYTINFSGDLKLIDPDSVDVLILLCHQLNEVDIIHQMRNRGFSGLIVSWFWDNHHHTFRDIDVAQESDICIPGHGFSTGHLISQNNILWKDPIPMCTTQWTKTEAQQFFAEYGYRTRLNNLYGGFTHYIFSQKRNEFLKQIIKGFPEHYIQLIEPEREQEYFGLMPQQKFEQWSSYKTSLCVPINQDLSQRFFDALLCGQIPIITPDIVDLDRLIPRSLQDNLPVVRLQGYDLDSLKVAYREAINRFDAEGLEGMDRRHLFALNNHLFVNRINTILEVIQEIGSQKSQFFEQEQKPLNFVSSSPNNTPFVSQSSLLVRNIPVVKHIDRLIDDCKKSIEHQSKNIAYWKQLIQLQVKKNNIDIAIIIGHKAIHKNPDFLEIYYLLGKIFLHEKEKLDEAYICFHKLILFEPNHAPSYYYISKIRAKQGRWDEAIASLKTAIQFNPNFSLAYQFLGELLLQQSQLKEQIEKAIYYLQKSINLNSNSWLAHYYLGYAFASQQRLEDAANCYQIVIQLNPAFESAYHLLGNVLSDLGHADQAAMYYLKAFEINPNLTWTSLHIDQQIPVDLDSILYPLWEGCDLKGKRILVQAGDDDISHAIYLMRYVLFIKEQGGEVILVATPPVVRLFSHQPFLDTVIAKGSPLPDHDVRIPLSSLPYLITPEKVVNTVPYLHPDPESRYQLLPVPVTEPGIKVGIAWSSKSQPEHSCRLEYFIKLFSGFGGTVYPLQAMTVDEQEQIKSVSIHWNGQNYTGDLAEQVALIQQLDLVITVDSVIAHLAGALGKPVWNLIPTHAQWNWWLENQIPSAYPTMHLFEQKQFGDWNSVFDELRVMLSSQYPNMSSLTTPSGKTNPINLPQLLYKQYQLSREDLTEKMWDFGRIDGSVIATIRLLHDGRIEGISSSNEARWELERTSLVFYNEQGQPTSCFNSFIQEQGKWIVTGLFLMADFVIHVLKEH